ncbi:hypothetical protein [Streptomyces triculaminicus]|uniref:hypothetical protein n=1 Tax=Streptomyces triculaminicus TaxID=2816232 RepID=UPI0037CE5B33
MASQARHARSPLPPPPRRRALTRIGTTLSAGAALVAAGAADAQAEPQAPRVQLARQDVRAALQGTDIALQKAVEGLSPVVKQFKYHPLAGTAVDPLNNVASTQILDFKPVSTAPVTAPITTRGQIGDLPVAGQVLQGLLPG